MQSPMVSDSCGGGRSTSTKLLNIKRDLRWSPARVMEAQCARVGQFSMVFGSYDDDGSMSAYTIYCCACATLLSKAHSLLTCGLM